MNCRIRLLLPLGVLLMLGACAHRPANRPKSPDTAVTGRVLFNGAVPPARKIAVPAAMAHVFPDGLTLQPYQISADGGLGEVLVYLVDPPPERPVPPTNAASLLVSNTICHPRVLAVYTNQPVHFQVTGGQLLNLSAGSKSGQGWNRAVAGDDEFVKQFARPELEMRLSDNNAVWLVATIAVFDHPWFAVTDAAGRFTLPPLPPGRYTLEMAHRRAGRSTTVVEVPGDSSALTLRLAPPPPGS